MEHSTSRRLIVPVLLGLVVAAVLIVGFVLGDRGTTGEGGEAEEAPRTIWRCHACARIEGQNWQTCKTVTGRGTEQAARDLVTQRVCEEASDPATQCRIVRDISCRELSEDAVKGAVPVKSGDP